MRPMNSSNIEQGELVVADIMFAEQEGKKRGLAMVISGTKYNKTSIDVVVLKVTSSPKNSAYAIGLTNESTLKGALKKNSKIVADFPVTLSKQNIRARPDSISGSKLLEVKRAMKEIYGI